MAHNLTDTEKALVALWEDQATQRQIAETLDLSLGQASGMIHRLKAKGVIKGRTIEQVRIAYARASAAKKVSEPAKVPKLIELPPQPAPAPPIVVAEAIADEDRVGVDIMKLARRHCRWVLPHRSVDGMPLYCGDAVDHRSFCACHAGRAFNVPNDWRPGAPLARRLKALITIAGR